MLSDLSQRLRLFLLIAGPVFLLSGCVLSIPGRTHPYPVGMKAVRITGEIAQLEQALPDPVMDKTRKSDIHLRLAMLYSHPDNPNPDFSRAVQHLAAYADTGGPVDSQYALMLLRLLEEKTAAIGNHTDSISALQERCDRLEQENREKTEIIEKLQSLDIKLEKKRKQTTGR